MRPLNCEVSDVAAVWGAPGVLRLGLDGDDPPETVGDVDYVIDLADGRIALVAGGSLDGDEVGRRMLWPVECVQRVTRGPEVDAIVLEWVGVGPEVRRGVS